MSALIRWATVVGALATACVPASAQSGGGRGFTVKAGVVVRPDTVRVGDPFLIQVVLQAPRGATVTFPDAPDSTTPVQALNSRSVVTGPDAEMVLHQATYRAAAWDIGLQRIPLADATVRLNGAVQSVPLSGHWVFVATVLPADTALRVPKPARPLIERTHIPWWVWALLALAAAAGAVTWWWLHRRKETPPPVVVEDPFDRAMREFRRVDALGLLEAAERGRHAALMVDVMREYFAARFPVAPLSLTSSELLSVARAEATVPLDRLVPVLRESDIIKFAGRPVRDEHAREIGRESRAIVMHEHTASQPRPSAAGQATEPARAVAA